MPNHYFGSPDFGRAGPGLPFAKNIQRRLASSALAAVFCLTTGFAPTLAAQKAPKLDRKVLVSAKPQYPEPLKQARIGGSVRLRATVLPNGTVSNVDVQGGNPILAESAAAAIKKWKFVPGTSETFEDITVNFNPRTE